MDDYTRLWGRTDLSPQEYMMRRNAEKSSLQRQSVRAGLCVIAFLVLEYTLSMLLVQSPLFALYQQNDSVNGLVEMFFYLVCMFLPFLVAYLTMRQEDRQTLTLFEKPTSKPAAAAAIIAGFLVCNAANYVTNVLLSLFDSAGISVEGGTYDVPQSGVQLVFSLLTIGILPAFVEEFALRGMIMQPLRRHGDRFAIVMSAFVFGLMHGNLSQFAFAFLVGLAIGYFVVATGSIWVGAAIHFLNNTYSVVLNYLLEVRPTAAETFYDIEASVSLIIGILCFVLFMTVCRRNRLAKADEVMTAGEKTRTYFLTVPMVIGILLLVIETIRLIHVTGN